MLSKRPVGCPQKREHVHLTGLSHPGAGGCPDVFFPQNLGILRSVKLGELVGCRPHEDAVWIAQRCELAAAEAERRRRVHSFWRVSHVKSELEESWD
jgi:hypothetical protein